MVQLLYFIVPTAALLMKPNEWLDRETSDSALEKLDEMVTIYPFAEDEREGHELFESRTNNILEVSYIEQIGTERSHYAPTAFGLYP